MRIAFFEKLMYFWCMSKHGEEFIRVKGYKDTKHISGSSLVVQFKDKETNMICLYIPSLDLSAYGDNIGEAEIMMEESLKFYLTELSKLSIKQIEQELFRLGWTKRKYKRKEFTPIHDIDQRMKEENITDYKVMPTQIAA